MCNMTDRWTNRRACQNCHVVLSKGSIHPTDSTSRGDLFDLPRGLHRRFWAFWKWHSIPVNPNTSELDISNFYDRKWL